MEDRTLNYIIYGQRPDSTESSDELGVLAMSESLTKEDAAIWRRLVTLSPMLPDSGQPIAAAGVFKGPEQDFILGRAQVLNGQLDRPLRQAILIPHDVFIQLTSSIRPLFDLLSDPGLPALSDNGLTAVPLPVPVAPPSPLDERAQLLDRLAQLAGGDQRDLLRLLGAALSDDQLLIRGAPPDFEQRLALMQGLMMLLPTPARRLLTFTTNVLDFQAARARVVFSDTAGDTTRHVANLASGELPADSVLEHPYVAYLVELWQENATGFVPALAEMDADASRLMAGRSLLDGLTAVAERHHIEDRLRRGEPVEAAVLKQLLTSDAPPSGDIRLMAAQNLLDYTLAERDPESVEIVASMIDNESDLSQLLREKLTDALQAEPDAVYFFIRTRLSQEVDPDWLPLLQAAAVIALEVAVSDTDDETLMSWLNLIAREPAGYDLQNVLREGILAAEQRILHDHSMGNELLLFTAKRAPDLIDSLVDDEAFISTLQPPLGPALRDYEPQAVAETIEISRELALVLMARAAQHIAEDERAARVFTPGHIDYLWALHNHENLDDLPEDYQPYHIISTLVLDGIIRLSVEVVEVLLARIVTGRETELFQQIARHLAQHNRLFPLLVNSLEDSAVSADDTRMLINLLVDSEIITRQQAVNTALQIVVQREWKRDTLPLVEQVTRLIQQTPAITMPIDIKWQMLELAEQTKTDVIARVMTRRLLAQMEAVEDDAQLIEMLVRLNRVVQWNGNARTHLLNWWRKFTREQGLTRLQRFDKLLEGNRAMEPARATVQTSLAVRRLLGKRTLNEFAETVSEAFSVLQALSDSFDPSGGRQALSFDPQTVRVELEARQDELQPDQRSVLAKNLKELTQIITIMAENRSKSKLMRREDDIERGLFTGEQHPQSAIDMMKWLSGLLDGMQARAAEDE